MVLPPVDPLALEQTEEAFSGCVVGASLLYSLDFSGNLYEMESTTGALTSIGSTGLGPTSGLAMDPSTGRLWTGTGGQLYSIDPATASSTLEVTLSEYNDSETRDLALGFDGNLIASGHSRIRISSGL
jgi:hypothetical protein